MNELIHQLRTARLEAYAKFKADNGIPNYPEEARDAGWRAFWAKLRGALETVRKQFVIQNRCRIRVRRRDGAWVLADMVLLPGALVSGEDTSSNRDTLVDSETHGQDGESLSTLGVREFPAGNVGPGDYRAITSEHDELRDWREGCRDTYKCTHQNSALRRLLEPGNFSMPSGWLFLAKLNELPNAKLTSAFLARIRQDTPRKWLHDCISRAFPLPQ